MIFTYYFILKNQSCTTFLNTSRMQTHIYIIPKDTFRTCDQQGKEENSHN